jgi:hypothetical protein
VLYACKGEHTLFTSQRERESEKEGKNEERLERRRDLCLQGCAHPLQWSEREREKAREKEGEGEGERGREREKK